ncbi:MAG: DUF1963 domain-containing protein [Treponema sp.]|nr:DUF1963 domain-containing protein [Treponema sp.]
MGKTYFYGEGILQDFTQAFNCFKKAAKQGHAEAQHYLGRCYDNSYGVSQDREKASEWFLKAAEQGHAKAQFEMGCRYHNNASGVKGDLKQAEYWEAKAAEQGYTSERFSQDLNDEWDRMDAARFRKYEKELNALNLKTIGDLEGLLVPLLRDAAKLIVERSEMPEDTRLKSHFAGQPYFEKGEQWPVTKDGEPLDFIFQFFNTNENHLPENIKLIQFYYSFDKRPWFTKDDGWLVKVYEKLNKENMVTIENPVPDADPYYCEIKYEHIKTLPHDHDLEFFDSNAEKLSLMLNEENPIYKIASKLKATHDLHSQIGGYPDWLQGGRYPNNKDFIFLFQIDSEEGLMWGDCGLVYAFYNPKTKKIIFELECC